MTSLVDYDPIDYPSVYRTGSGKLDPVKVRNLVRQVQELAQKHKITVVIGNKMPEGDPSPFVIPRNYDSIRFMPNIEQVRFPRSKKKRIRKKWAMNPANWKEKPLMWGFVAKARDLAEPDGVHQPFMPSYIRRPKMFTIL